MCRRSLPVVVLFCAVLANAGEKKKKQTFPQEILNAHTVAVVIYPGSEIPLANPGENRKAVNDVESAVMRWGRYALADPAVSDLVIAVRKGRAVGPAISPPRDSVPVILNPSDAGVHVGVRRGNPPDLGGGPSDDKPRVGSSVGSSEDVFSVYRGRGISDISRQAPLDAPPLWRFIGKNALDAPAVSAVAAFRKAVEEADKHQP